MRDCRKCDEKGRCVDCIDPSDADTEFTSGCPYEKDERYKCWNYEGKNE